MVLCGDGRVLCPTDEHPFESLMRVRVASQFKIARLDAQGLRRQEAGEDKLIPMGNVSFTIF